MNAAKKVHAPNKLMPDKYIRFKNYIVYTIPENFCVAEVLITATGDNKGKEYANYTCYYSSLENAIQGLGNKISHDLFPDLTSISNEIKELKELVKKGLHVS